MPADCRGRPGSRHRRAASACAAPNCLLFADHRDIVFRLAGDDAVVAADAGVQVDRHAPGVRFCLRTDRACRRSVLAAALLPSRSPVLCGIPREFACRTSGRVPRGRVHGLVALGGGQLVGAAGLANRYAAGNPRRGAGAQRYMSKPAPVPTRPARRRP